MEEKKLLSKTPLKRLIASVLIFALVSTPTFAFAGSFEDALGEGKNLGRQDVLNFNPQNIDQTLQERGLSSINEITPRVGEAQGQQGDYSQYYTNPGGMSGAPSGEAGEFVTDSYEQRPKFDLSEDSDFGNKCLERGADGRCLRWSGSKDLLVNTYPDCQKVIIPQYGETSEQTCTGTTTANNYDCEIRSNVSIETEEVQGPCSQVEIDVKPGQIYAVCRDKIEIWRVFKANFVYFAGPLHCLDDTLCSSTHEPRCSNPDWYYCDFCCGGSCPPAYRVESESELPEGSIYLGKGITDITYTGHPDERTAYGTYYHYYKIVRPSIIERVYRRKDSPCGDNLERWFEECSVETYAQCGSGCLTCVNVVENGEETGESLDPSLKCQPFSGSIENYAICLEGQGVSLNSRSLTTNAVREESTTQENGLTVTWARLYGGSGVGSELNDWCGRVTFSCGAEQDNCQALRDQGCVLYSQRCLDSDCDQIEYTYRCGQGGIIGYRVAYNCAGELRCIGTDCVDASYEANTDFASAATITEVLNQYRADSSEISVFPGEEQDCQKSPKNCCKNAIGGISIGNYVSAAHATIKLYSILSGGASATWAGYANAFSYVLTGGEYGSLSGLLGNTITDVLGLKSSTLFTEIGFINDDVALHIGAELMEEGGMTKITVDAALISNLATIATVITIALAVYSVISIVYNWYFQCTREDILTSSKVDLRLCHYVGSKCSKRFFGICIKRKKVYCCFNSLLVRLIHEQGRPQLGIGWGSAEGPNCRGFTPEELASIDFSQVDLREYMQYVVHQTEVSPEKAQEIMDRVRQKYE